MLTSQQSIAFYDAVIVSATVTILDLLSADPTTGYWEKIVEEATATFNTDADWIRPENVSKLAYTDSAIRESLRLNPFSIRSVNREVACEKGVVLPSGTHLPQGTWITTALANVHHDERFYTHPKEYRPFRFIAERPFSVGIEDNTQVTESIATSTIDEKFLTFGFGRRAW